MKSRKLGNIGNTNNNLDMTKKLKKMQNKLDVVSKEIEEMTFIGISGGGTIEVMIKGDKTPLNIKIKEESKEELKNDLAMLFDLVIAALNDGFKKIDEYTDKEIERVTAGLPIPGLN